MCNFRDSLTFKHVGENEINFVESFIQSKLPTILSNWKSRENGSPISDIDLFGPVYEFMPNLFQFAPGDRLLIASVSSHVKNVTSTQPQYFKWNDDILAIDSGEMAQKMSCLTINNEEEKSINRPHLLNKLVEAADRNATRKKGGYRYEYAEKSFATYLRMVSGPLAYETIQKNLSTALPSLSSTNRYIRQMKSPIIEGVLRCNELQLFLEQRQLPKIVSISEDATRIIGRVQYDRKTNQLVGFVQPIDRTNGMPVPFSFPARDVEEIIQYFDGTHMESTFLNAIMAQPIGFEESPAFCLMLFSSDNKYTSEDVCNRWKFIIDALNGLGIVVFNFSSDSDPRYNAAMRKMSLLGNVSNLFSQKNWYRMGIVKSITNVNEFETIYTQDSTHIGTKLRNLMLKTIKNNKKLPIGKYYIQQSHLKQLIDRFPKDQHNLTRSTLNPVDKQNFDSVKRICSNNVVALLRSKVHNSHGTVKFLEIMQYIIDSYMDQTLSPLERVYKIWYSVFMLRLWRAFIVSKKNLRLKENFMSMNCYICIELNAHSLLKMLIQLKEINMPHLFMLHQLGSQPCESLFRQARSLTSTYSTVINFSVKEFSERMNKIELQNQISSNIGNVYLFPRLGCKKNNAKVFELPSFTDIHNTLGEAKNNAMADAIVLGLVQKSRSMSFDFACNINAYVNKRSKECMPDTIKRNRFSVAHEIRLDKVILKNFADRFEEEEVENYSPYLEIYRDRETGKRIIVKKTSFIWLIRNDPIRLSIDRLERVKGRSKKVKIRKKNHSTICGYHEKTYLLRTKKITLFN